MHKPTVTIATTALDEEGNIENFLGSILRQTTTNFILEKILIISDGSTDQTVKKIKSIRSNKILVINSTVRLGKPERLNQIYKLLTSDILVTLDADIILSHNNVIEEVVKPLIKDKHVGMSGGNAVPLPGNTFIEKAIRTSYLAYYPLRLKLLGGNNSLSVDGKIIACKKEVAKKMHIPKDTTGEDIFTYLYTLKLGLLYRYAPRAIIHFSLPRTLIDHIKQTTRFSATAARMSKYFDKEVIDRESYVPKHLLFFYMLVQFIKHPILSGFIYSVNTYCRMRARKMETQLTAKWEIAYSTKINKR